MKFITKVTQSSILKRFLLLFLLLTLFTSICAFSYVNAISSDIANNLFRLHVIANSNSEKDQALKYIVRDSITEYMNEKCKNLRDKEQVILFVKNNMEQIKKVAQDTVYNNGYNYTVNIDIGNFNFPTKQYGDISLPAGFYDALKIEIGEARGNNWWCVMFPPLCFVDVSSGIVPDDSKEIMRENLLDEEYRLISDDSADMKIKFKVVELFQNISITLANS